MSKVHGALEGLDQGFFHLLRVLSGLFSSQFVDFTFSLQLASNYFFRILKILVKNCLGQIFCDLSGGSNSLPVAWVGFVMEMPPSLAGRAIDTVLFRLVVVCL